MSALLDTIRSAVRGGHLSSTATAAPGPIERGASMAQEDFDAGFRAGTDRIATALTADGIKGNAKRMAAALDIAAKNPAMSSEDIATFVVEHVDGEPKAESQAAHDARVAAASYEPRVVGAGLARPDAQRSRSVAGWGRVSNDINAHR